MIDNETRLFLRETAIKLEKERNKLKSLNTLYNVFVRPLIFFTNVVTMIVLFFGLIFPPMLLWLLLSLGVYYGLKSINKPHILYVNHVKNKILPDIFKKINPNFKYDPYGFDIDVLKMSGIFTKSFFNNHTYIEGEDLVSGTIDGVKILFNEIKFYRKQVNYWKTFWSFVLTIVLIPIYIISSIINSFQGDDGNRDDFSNSESGSGIPFFDVIREEKNFYKGLFMYADFHKNFSGQVFMFPRKMDSMSDKLQGTNFKEIKIENIELDKVYKIYCTNEQMGYYVLSPTIIEAIQDIINIEKVFPVITFISGKMFMTIPWDKDYFSVNLNDKVISGKYFMKYINEINSFHKIIKHFSLDQRIWTKE